MVEPILIMAMPRTGSSMTAGIFAEHGVWHGTCRPPGERNPKGFFENIAIRDVMVELHGPIVHNGTVAQPVDGLREKVERAIRRDGYEDGPWMWKGSAFYAPAWHEFDPKWVICRRDKDSTFRSCRHAQNVFGHSLSDKRLREIIDMHHHVMDYLVAERGGVEVDTEAVARKDLTTIQEALAYAGVDPDDALIDSFVDPGLWHFKSA